MIKIKENEKTVYTFLLLTLICLGLFSLFIGKYEMSVSDVFKSMVFSSTEMNNKVFWVLRVPRTLMVVFGGVALGIAGNVCQTLFKNPLASPDVIGISSGANLGACIAIVTGISLGHFGIAVGSFIGAVIAVACIFGLSNIAKSHSTTTYVLAGIIINAFARALIMVLKYFVDSDSLLVSIEYWEMGTFSNVSTSSVTVVLPLIIVSLTAIVILRRKIEMLTLSDDEARSLGIRIKSFRIIVIVFTTLLVSSVISVTGLISFVSLISPHIARQILKKNNSSTLLISGLTGGILTAVSDILVRIISTVEMPVSILTATFGLPVLIILMIKRRNKN